MKLEAASIFKDRRGFTLIDIMVAMGLAAVAIITTVAIIGQASRVRKAENLITSALAVRSQLFRILDRYDNFQATIYHSNNNGVFDCVRNKTCGTLGSGGGNFDIRLATDNSFSASIVSESFYNAISPNNGFTEDGEVCSSSSATPNSQCPIRANLSWVNRCVNCNPALIEVRVQILTFNSGNNSADTTPVARETPYGFYLLKSVYASGASAPYP